MRVKEDSLRDRIEKSVKILGDLEPRAELQVAILESLLDGPKTVGELTADVLEGGPEDYQARYMKVRRAARTLESKGYISTPLLGKPRPYRLTPFARESLGTLASQDLSPARLVSTPEMMLYILTALLAALLALGVVYSLLLAMAFVYLMGISSCCLTRTLRRVS